MHEPDLCPIAAMICQREAAMHYRRATFALGKGWWHEAREAQRKAADESNAARWFMNIEELSPFIAE